MNDWLLVLVVLVVIVLTAFFQASDAPFDVRKELGAKGWMILSLKKVSQSSGEDEVATLYEVVYRNRKNERRKARVVKTRHGLSLLSDRAFDEGSPDWDQQPRV